MLNFEDIAQITVEAVHESQADNEKEKTIEELRRGQITEHVNDLIENSSLHGVSYIFDKGHSIRRVIWFLITVAAVTCSMMEVYKSTVHYLDYPFNTARRRQYVDEIEFPAVSFCNVNDMRMSVLNGTKVDAAILDNDKAEFVTAEEYRNVTRAAAHVLEEMLVDCNFNGQKCTKDNFTIFNWMQGDRCFTFNSGKDGHKILTLPGTGVERSLTFTINLQHYDYYRDGMVAGVHLILHGQDETPVRMRGAIIPPGYKTYLEIEKKKIINLEPPYKTRCGSLSLKYFEGYSMHTCWLEQLTDHVEKHCQCKDFFMPGDIPICSLQKAAQCMWPQWEAFTNKKQYKCPLPCEIDSYHGKSVSRALFPSASYAKKLEKNLEKLPHMKNVMINNTKRFLRDNLLRVVIYYDNMSYELLEQQPSYDTLAWLGDVGGQVGLFIGAGVMSYFEFIDCIALVIYAKFFQPFRSKSKSEKFN